MNSSRTLRRLFLLSLIVLLISLTILARSSLLRNFGEDPIGYNGPVKFSLGHIKSTGHIIREGDINAPTLYSGAIYYAEGFPLHATLPVSISLVVGDDTSLHFQMLISVFLTTAFFCSIGSFILKAPRGRDTRNKFALDWTSIVFLAFGSAGVFWLLGGSNAGFEFVIMPICFSLLLTSRLDAARVIALVVMSVFLPMFHFTAGILYASFLLGIVLYSSLVEPSGDSAYREQPGSKMAKKNIRQYSIFFMVFYCGYVIVFARHAFDPFASFLFVSIGSAWGGNSPANVLGDVIAEPSRVFFVLNSVGMALFILPVLLILAWLLADISKRRVFLLFMLSMFAPLAWMAAAFFVWMGIVGFLQRVSLYVFYPILLVLPLGRFVGRRFLVVLLCATIVAVPVTIIIHTQSPYNRGGYAVASEEELADWSIDHVYEQQVVFTDLRLSGLLVSQGHLFTAGISDAGEAAARSLLILEDLFYNPTEKNFAEGISLVELNEGVNVDLIFVSSRMAMDYPAIHGYDYAFRPASNDFLSVYDGIESICLVCDTGTAKLYSMGH